ncbi:hypothetical protein CAter10_3222 [Collimonas arenae]|nr:hypothetical protein CAter10_3222 [Collimonas arenae]
MELLLPERNAHRHFAAGFYHQLALLKCRSSSQFCCWHLADSSD